MFQSLRDFVHWADALLNVDTTARKCNDVYSVVNDQIEDKEQAARASKETSQMYVNLLTSLAPSIIGLLTKEDSKPDLPRVYAEPVHVGRQCTPPVPRYDARPVVVDRDEQGAEQKIPGPSRAPAAAPAMPDSQMMIQQALRSIRSAYAELHSRVSNLEATVGHSKKPVEPVGAPPIPDPPAS